MTRRTTQLIEWLNTVIPYTIERLELVSGDASFRRYYRFEVDDTAYIAVDAPPETENNEAFVSIAKTYEKNAVRVPEVVHYDFILGFMCLEDFGDLQLSQVMNGSNYQEYYTKALDCLVKIQAVSNNSEYSFPCYGEALLARDFSLFTEWFLGTHLELNLSEKDTILLEQVFHILSANFAEQPQVGVHRDFHSRNIMHLRDGNLGIIDFQDTAIGPMTYDVVSLLRDCYIRWPDEEISSLLKSSHKQYFNEYPWPQFRRWFDLTGLQRHLKAIGIFARLHHRDSKSMYLQDIPRTLSYIVDVGKDYQELATFITFIENKVLTKLENYL